MKVVFLKTVALDGEDGAILMDLMNGLRERRDVRSGLDPSRGDPRLEVYGEFRLESLTPGSPA